MRDVNAILFAVNRGFKRYMNARQEFLAFNISGHVGNLST